MIKKTLNYALKIMVSSVILSLIHLFIANSIPIYSYIFSNTSSTAVLASITSVLHFVAFFALLFSLLLVISKWLTYLTFVVINLIGCIYSYYVFTFGIQMSDELMVSMLFFVESNDISSSFDWKIFIYVPLLLLPSLIAMHYTLKNFDLLPSVNFNFDELLYGTFLRLGTIIVIVGVLVSYLGIIYKSKSATLQVYKIRTVAEQAMPSYFMARRSNISKLRKVYDKNIILQDYTELGLYKESTQDEPLIVTFIVGESLRSNKLAINGYHRNTTPKMQIIPNLFSFKDVLACSTTTAVSMPCMLTDESLEGWTERFSTGQYTPKYSFARAFSDIGYDTHWISSANKDYGIYINKDFHGSNSVMLSNELRRKYLSSKKDFGDLLLVNALKTDVNKDTLYVLGSMGSHREYFSRYTDSYSVFKPDRGNSIEIINNAYDNTVIYFDTFVDEIVQKLKTKNALVIYVSDHGESLGEDGIFLHGAKVETAPKEQLNVPLIVWMSDYFVANNDEKHQNIKRWLSLNNNSEIQLTHDHIFHSILDCSGIKSSSEKGINTNLSLCSPPPQ